MKVLLLARLIVTLAALFLAFHLSLLVRDLRDASQVMRAQESLRKLAALTIRNFPDRNLGSAEIFWKAIGRDTPINDTWGTDYSVSSEGVGLTRKIVWHCAGPDRKWGTRDDIDFVVPYADGLGAAQGAGAEESNVNVLPATDAK